MRCLVSSVASLLAGHVSDALSDSQQNIQNTLFEQLCYEVMVEKWGSSKNFFTFTRSAVDRARSLAAIWNGDPHATFDGLAYSVASGIRAGLLLFSTWGSDVGGYVRPDANSPSEELWARWMQFGAFSPMYEIMVGTGHTPWYEPYTGALVDVLKTTADWHTMLIPFIRSYTAQAVKTGIPVMRALFLEYPADDAAYTASDSYAFGAEFFVAPFVSAGGSRKIHFPSAGAGKPVKFLDWLDKKTVYAGGSDETVQLPLGRMPVYVREGSIVPTGDVHRGNAQWIAGWKPSLEIEFYPSFAVNATAFEFARADGATAMIRMRTDRAAETVSIATEGLGLGGKLKVYTKTGVAEIAFADGGMSVSMDRVKTLFD
jgi:alpha-D-xyloside xylohydrolase